MAKYLDLKVGKKLKIFRLKSGTNQKGNWAFFTYTPAEKDQNGNYIYGQEYTIIVNNVDKLCQLQDGMQVEIESIISVTAEYQSYTSKQTNQKINKMVMKVTANLKTDNQQNNNFQNPQNQNSNNFNDFNNSFGGYDMPDFL